MDVEPSPSPPPASQLDAATLRRRARRGVFWLGARTAAQQLIGLLGQVVLARLLGPGEFGTFWIVQSVLAFFTLFGDAGFGAALIQKRNDATREELSSVFWAQLLLGTMVMALVFVSAPLVVRVWPSLPDSGVWMVRALSLNLLLTSCRVIPTILLERELLFGRLAVIDLVLTASLYSTSVALAYLGYGAYALVGGVLAQGLCGLLGAYLARPFRPGLVMRWSLLRPIAKFGLVFQVKNMIAFTNGAVMPVYGGSTLGTYGFGLVSWSQSTAFFPVQIVTILARVNFPLLSRLQHDPEQFAATLARSVRLCAAATMLFVALFLGLGPEIVRVIYGDRWLPALPTLYVFASALSIGFVVPIMGASLDALGRPGIMMRLAIGWTAINWVVVLVAMQLWRSPLAFSLAYCVHMVVGNLAVIVAAQRLLPTLRMAPNMVTGVFAGAVVAALGRQLLLPWVHGPFSLIVAVLLALCAFVAVCVALDRSLLAQLRALLHKSPAAR